MIPGTVATLVSFVLFVAPGLLWELLVARRKPTKDESAFREVSRIAVVSAPFSALAVAATLLLARAVHAPWISQLTSWVRTGQPPTNSIMLVGAVLVVVELVIAGSLLGLTWLLFGTRIYGEATLLEESAWTFALRKPKDSDEVWATVRLQSGDRVRGRVLSFTADFKWADREVTLGAPLSVLASDGMIHPLYDQCLVIPAASIEYVASMIPPPSATAALPAPTVPGAP